LARCGLFLSRDFFLWAFCCPSLDFVRYLFTPFVWTFAALLPMCRRSEPECFIFTTGTVRALTTLGLFLFPRKPAVTFEVAPMCNLGSRPSLRFCRPDFLWKIIDPRSQVPNPDCILIQDFFPPFFFRCVTMAGNGSPDVFPTIFVYFVPFLICPAPPHPPSWRLVFHRSSPIGFPLFPQPTHNYFSNFTYHYPQFGTTFLCEICSLVFLIDIFCWHGVLRLGGFDFWSQGIFLSFPRPPPDKLFVRLSNF